MNDRCVAVTKRAYESLDSDGKGYVLMSDLIRCFHSNKYIESILPCDPLKDCVSYITNTMGEGNDHCVGDNCQNDFYVLWEQFVDYYCDLFTNKFLNHKEKRKESDKSGYFELIVERSWGLSVDRSMLLPPKEAVTSISVPEGVAATERLNLMWVDPQDPTMLCGYRAVVKPVFARACMPVWLRSHFLTVKETEQWSFRFLNVQTALLAPFDVVWEVGTPTTRDPDQKIELVGLKGVVASNVEIYILPAKLREIFMTSIQSEQCGVEYLHQEDPKENPMYMSSNKGYGKNVGGATKMLSSTTASSSSDPIGGGGRDTSTWNGRTGHFTAAFASGPYRQTGLNTSATRKFV